MGETSNRWKKDASGHQQMPKTQSDYLDWLLDDDQIPDTEAEWCRSRNVPRETVRKWRQDRRFRETWERRSVEKHISPERMQKVLDVLYQSAIGTGDVAAAKQYLLHTEKFLPPKQILRDASVAHMSDAELRSEVEAILASGFGAP